ncbi:MAG: alpha/beta fold hydrolase, partial [Acidimicrobiales bacterium]
MTSEFPDTPRLLRRPDIDLAVYESGQGRPVILSHGFPELAFSWRHQLAALAGAGYHALVPDQRG